MARLEEYPRAFRPNTGGVFQNIFDANDGSAEEDEEEEGVVGDWASSSHQALLAHAGRAADSTRILRSKYHDGRIKYLPVEGKGNNSFAMSGEQKQRYFRGIMNAGNTGRTRSDIVEDYYESDHAGTTTKKQRNNLQKINEADTEKDDLEELQRKARIRQLRAKILRS